MGYLVHLGIIVCIYAILAMSLNLTVGYTGLMSITQAAFYGIGAYAAAILMAGYGFNFFAALLLSIIITSAISMVIGFVLARFKDDYFALGSLGFNIIVYGILVNWQSLTNGPLGIINIPRPAIFGVFLSDNIWFLALAIVFTTMTYLLCRHIGHSSFGRVLKAIREDEKAIQIFGYNTTYFKLAIFVIAAAIAAVAGALFASYISYIDPTSFTLNESILVLAMIILGGLANNKGAVLGAVCLVLLPEALRFVGFPDGIAAQMRQALYGVILIILAIYRPQGLIGEYKI